MEIIHQAWSWLLSIIANPHFANIADLLSVLGFCASVSAWWGIDQVRRGYVSRERLPRLIVDLRGNTSDLIALARDAVNLRSEIVFHIRQIAAILSSVQAHVSFSFKVQVVRLRFDLWKSLKGSLDRDLVLDCHSKIHYLITQLQEYCKDREVV